MVLRPAQEADLDQLVLFNQQLIIDQQHDNPATPAQLRERMARWLASAHVLALLEQNDTPVGYAVWRQNEDGVYLRQFFIARGWRRQGLERDAFMLLQREWAAQTVKLDVLRHNEPALSFYRALGYADYSLILRKLPTPDARG